MADFAEASPPFGRAGVVALQAAEIEFDLFCLPAAVPAWKRIYVLRGAA